MLEWKDVIQVVVSVLSSDGAGTLALLEFLTVLPEEVTEGRKVSLTVCGYTQHPARTLLTSLCNPGGGARRTHQRVARPKCGTSFESTGAILSVYTYHTPHPIQSSSRSSDNYLQPRPLHNLLS